MKLVIQLPCYNEETTLAQTLNDLPREIPGVSEILILVIDDGSQDRTVEVAKSNGVDHILSLVRNEGLARAFARGIEESLSLGADIIVNTDADNQYNAEDISRLVQPILDGKAEMVIGARPIDAISHFSPLKKLLQRLGSGVVRSVSGTDVDDAPSGFRAFTRSAAMRLNVFSEYTYTLETIIQAGQNNIPIVSIPVRVNKPTRPSRLMKSIPGYIRRSAATIFRIFVTYRPLRFFLTIASAVFLGGFALALRYLHFLWIGEGAGHVQSVILSGVLMLSGVLFGVIALLADLISVNRRLLEKLNWRIRKLEDQIIREHEKNRPDGN